MPSIQYFGGLCLTSFHQIVDGVGILGFQICRETFVAQIVKIFVTSLFAHDESNGTEFRDKKAKVSLIEISRIEKLIKS
jgi:hypothetical protein